MRARWVWVFALLWACDEGGEETPDDCGGACGGGTTCVSGQCVPRRAPTPDAAVELDAAVLPDAAPDGPPPDAPIPDALVDAPPADWPDLPVFDGPSPDGPEPDAALPDAALPDGALPDMALPDMALPDMALPDMAPPDGPPGCVPVEEVCNGVDDDCDEAVDESDPELGMPCDSGEPGPCDEGQWLCHDGERVCPPVREPVAEVCDTVDNDCDGETDEGLPEMPVPCDSGEPGACAAGLEACVDGDFVCVATLVPAAERCNGVDDDCDGPVDETFPELGGPCAVGVGECRVEAGVVCAADEVSVTCGAVAAAPTDEVCDGLDNDCNEAVDDLQAPPEEPDHCGACGRACEFPNAHGLCRAGDCFPGHCRAGFLDFDRDPENGCEQACRPTDPDVEVCDGLDNDCDGVVDDGVCQGDPFRFCHDRDGVTHDRSCDDFGPGGLAAQWWSPSLVGVGADVPVADRQYRAAAPFAEGGGHTRRLHRTGPGLRLGMHVEYRGGARVGVGVFDRDTLVEPVAEEEGGEPPGHGPAGNGYVVWLEGPAGEPEVIVRRSPDDLELLRAPIRALGDGARHWLEATRAADGAWSLRFDGRTVAPEGEVLVDDTTTVFDRLSVFVDAFEGEATRIDDLVVSADRDGDDVYPPQDNCPFVANADQHDQDDDGRGSACDDRDGDGLDDGVDPCPALADADGCDFGGQRLLVGLKVDGPMSPWHVDPVSGVRWRHLLAEGDRGQMRTSADGRQAWALPDGSLFVDGELQAVARTAPSWLGDRLLYHDAGHTQVYLGTPAEGGMEGEALFVAAPDGLQVRAVVAPDGVHVALLTVDGFDSSIRLLDGEGAEAEAPLLIPPAGPSEIPALARHPARPMFALAAEGGAARGVGLVSDGVYLQVSDAPASAVTFSPDGDWVFAVEAGDEGWRLTAYPTRVEGDVYPRSILVPDNRWLSADTLGWAPDDAVAPDDADGDGRHDAVDPCHDVPHLGPVREVAHIGHLEVDGPRLFPGEDAEIVTWYHTGLPSGFQENWIRRLDDDGFSLGTTRPVRVRFAAVSTMAMAWRAGRYQIAYSVGPEAYVRTMAPAVGALGPPQPLDRSFARAAVVPVDDGEVVLAHGGTSLGLLRLDPDGARVATTPRVDNKSFYDFAAVWNGERLLVAGVFHREPPQVYVMNKSGVVVARHPLVAHSNGDAPTGTWIDMVWSGTHGYVVWRRPPDRTIRLVKVDRNGVRDGGEHLIARGTTNPAEPRLVFADDRLYAVWRADGPGGHAIYFARLDEDGARLADPVRITTDGARATEPNIVWDGERFTVSWLEQRNARRDFHIQTGVFHCPN